MGRVRRIAHPGDSSSAGAGTAPDISTSTTEDWIPPNITFRRPSGWKSTAQALVCGLEMGRPGESTRRPWKFARHHHSAITRFGQFSVKVHTKLDGTAILTRWLEITNTGKTTGSAGRGMSMERGVAEDRALAFAYERYQTTPVFPGIFRHSELGRRRRLSTGTTCRRRDTGLTDAIAAAAIANRCSCCGK